MRTVRRLCHALLLVLTLLVGATAAVVIVSQTVWFKNWLRGYVVREAGRYLNGTLSIDRLGGNLFFGLEMENVGVSMDGSQVVAVKDLGLDYNVFELISKGLSVNNIRLDQPVVYLRREGDAWSISRLIKKQEEEANRQGPMRPISIDQINITDGSVVLEEPAGPVGTAGRGDGVDASGAAGVELPRRLEHLDAKLTFRYAPVHYTIDITQVSFRGLDPAIAVNAVSGRISVRDDTVFLQKLALHTAETSLFMDGAVQHYLTTPIFNMQVSSDKTSFPEMARLLPALSGVELQPAFELTLDGPLDHLGVEMNVRSSAGEALGKLVVDLAGPRQSASGTVSIRHLDLSPILNDVNQKSDITADATLDVHGPSLSDVNGLRGTLSFNAPRVMAAGFEADRVKGNARIDGRQWAIDTRELAYGASATTGGLILLPSGRHGATAFDLHGQARHVDLRRLPRDLKIPPAATDINAEYHVSGSVPTKTHDASDSSRTAEGEAHFAASTVAGARIGDGTTAGFTLKGQAIDYRTHATVADLDAQRIGQEFHIPALAADRWKSSINGHVIASGRGTTARETTLTASGTLHGTSIMGGRIPQMAFDVAVQRNTVHVNANGSFSGVDPAIVSGRQSLKGAIGGTVDLDASLANASQGITPDNVQATAKVSLGPSSIAGLAITSATIDGDYRNSTADIRTFHIVGRDLNAQVSGTLALGETGQSNLKVHADSPSLEQIGTLVDQPISGIGTADFTVTGNKRQLQTTGNLTGDGVKYDSNGALSISSDFTAQVPEWDAASASVSATTHGTFVTIAGQNINDLSAKTDYADRQVAFDATAKQPQRTVAAAGLVLVHPDHREIHLQRLSLMAQGMTWETAAGSEATIQYAKGAAAVDNFKLVSGNQQIAADGTYGRQGDRLKITFNDVDVGMIDALKLRPPQLSGRLNATATVTSVATSDAASGSGRTPQVNADFTISMGGFRQFHYDTFAGTVSYTANAIVLDTKLQHDPRTWIEAKGRVPAALFGDSGMSSGEPIELRVDSTPIDVGLVQGLTTELMNATGTLEAHVSVTGSAADPHPDGTVTIQNAAFTLQPTGVVYTGLDGKVDLRPDRVHIDQIRVLDNQQKPLTITGDLALREGEVGAMSIAIKSDDFKVVDNQMGNVRINSDLRLTGELNAPRLEGNLSVNTGQVNLDEVLNLVGPSAYATEQTEYTTTPNTAAGAIPKSTQGATSVLGIPGLSVMYDALQVDVQTTVPDDLVLKASDLTAPGAPIGLGALIVTLGGDVYVSKVPYDQVRLFGRVNTVRGTYNFQGRQFTILRNGTVRFEGLDDLDPELDIRTERVIQAVTANVNVRGTLKQPEIALSSTPPLEPADILSLIVFNQPINQLGEGDQISLAQRGQQLATSAVASELASSIGNALNLNTFEISTAPSNGATAQLTVGQQLGQNLYLKVEQGIGDQSQTNFIFEYELATWLRLQTNVVQGSSTQQHLFKRAQGSGLDLLFFFSY